MIKHFIILLTLSLMIGVYAQHSSPEVWQETLVSLTAQNTIPKVVIHYQESLKKANGKTANYLWNVITKLEALENPTCRCLPEPKGKVTFYFQENQSLVIELVQDHWFNAVYVGKGQVFNFILKDEKNQLFNTVEKLMNPYQSSSSDPFLCPSCLNKMFISSIGNCQSCSGMTSSGAFKFCTDCAHKKNACQACGLDKTGWEK